VGKEKRSFFILNTEPSTIVPQIQHVGVAVGCAGGAGGLGLILKNTVLFSGRRVPY
jgi:hypothetical protein